MNLAKLLFGGFNKVAAAYANNQAFPKVLTLPVIYEPAGFVSKYLTQRGNDAVRNMNVNASMVSPVIFEYVVPSSPTPYFFAIGQINMMIVDATITIDKFGGIAGPLSNGILWQIVNASDEVIMTMSPTGVFKQNWDFYHVGGAQIQTSGSQDFIAVKWQGQGLGVLPTLRPGYKIQCIIRDDLRGLTAMEVACIGAYLPNDVQFVYQN